MNFGDEIGMTPLHIAAANLNTQGIQILLNLGANRRAKANTSSSSTPKMQTPVQIARDWKRLIKKNFGKSHIWSFYNNSHSEAYQSIFLCDRHVQTRC